MRFVTVMGHGYTYKFYLNHYLFDVGLEYSDYAKF
jgi:hypothetical protein